MFNNYKFIKAAHLISSIIYFIFVALLFYNYNNIENRHRYAIYLIAYGFITFLISVKKLNYETNFTEYKILKLLANYKVGEFNPKIKYAKEIAKIERASNEQARPN